MTKEIQKELATHLLKNGVGISVCENFSVGSTFECDVAVLSQGNFLHEYEVKISRSDFLADKNKLYGKTLKFDHYAKAHDLEKDWEIHSIPNYFHYVCPSGLILKNEIPSFAGLYYYSVDGIQQIVACKRLHKVPFDRNKVITKMLRLTAERKYFGCSKMTFNNRIKLEKTES